jgi:hypothetical protein
MTTGFFYSVCGPITLPAGGTWIIKAGVQLTGAGNVSELKAGFSLINRTTGSNSATAYIATDATYLINNPTGQVQILHTYIYQTTTASRDVYYNLTSTNSAAPTINSSTYGFMRAVKIA